MKENELEEKNELEHYSESKSETFFVKVGLEQS